MKIGTLNMLEYCLAFAGHRTPLADRYAAQAAAEGLLYGARADGKYAGFLCGTDEADYVRVAYALTMPEYRHRGVFEALLGQAAEAAGKPMRMTLAQDHPCRYWVRSAAEKLGFVPEEQVTVFSCRREDEAVWRRFMDTRGRRMCAALERQGYRAVPFTALDGSLTEQLRASDRSEYGNTFHPGLYLDEPARRLRPDLSAAAVRDGRLKAYCLVTEGDENTAMFDQISVAADVMGRGVILLPYVTAMELFFEQGLERAYYAMYGSNLHAGAFRDRILKMFPTGERVMENYCRVPPAQGV